MSRETSKAMRRRMGEDVRGEFPWSKILKGHGLDIGAGDDPLPVPDCRPFDKQDGDANKLSEYVVDRDLDYIHGSQVVEHLHNPEESLVDWATLLKPKGYLVFSVPEAGLYGDILWTRGPRYNNDHKATFSMWYKGSPAPIHYYVPIWLPTLETKTGTKVKLARVVDTNYDYKKLWLVDQTQGESEGVEAFLEFVLQKL